MKPVVKKRKMRRISRTKKGKKQNNYFHEGTTAAILAYQDSDNEEEKEKLYISEIYPAFDKLAENLIFIYGFQGLYTSYDDLKADCVTFLYEAINKYDRSRGSKTFSYFNVVAKNWLIIRSKQRSQKVQRSVSIDNRDSLGKRDVESIENFQTLPSQDDQFEDLEFIFNIQKMLGEIESRVTNENEKACMAAVIHIFKNIDKVELLKKRAVFFYIRDISNLTPKQLTTAIASIKRHYKELKNSEKFGIY